MPRFFVPEVQGEHILILGEDARHISLSLRMRAGEKLTVCDGKGNDYLCRILTLSRESVALQVEEKQPSPGEPEVKITLFQALSKGDKMEVIVQKAVELGVFEIVPLLTSRCVVRADRESFEKKRQRLGRIALEAAKQCGRGIIPQVRPLVDLQELCGLLGGFDQTLFFYENATRKLSSIPLSGVHTLGIVVGAEGGFDGEEAEEIVQSGALAASLGGRILRCETAPIAALGAILYALKEM